MNMYVIADAEWGIYKNGNPIVSIPAEEKSRLGEITGKVIVYDDSYVKRLPGQQPLRDTVNLVYTRGIKKDIRNAFTFDTIDGLRKAIKKYKSSEVYIINSEELYREFLKDTSVVHVAKLDRTYDADAFFPDIDKDADFVLTADSDEQYCFDIVYNFLKYERKEK